MIVVIGHRLLLFLLLLILLDKDILLGLAWFSPPSLTWILLGIESDSFHFATLRATTHLIHLVAKYRAIVLIQEIIFLWELYCSCGIVFIDRILFVRWILQRRNQVYAAFNIYLTFVGHEIIVWCGTLILAWFKPTSRLLLISFPIEISRISSTTYAAKSHF